MKKFISMLAGVVMASSLFVASAYAAGNVTFTADKTEVKEGETITITINSLAKTVSTDGFNVEFDTDVFECTSVAGNYYEQWHAIKQVAPPIDKMYDPVSTVAEANTQGKFGFAFAGGSDVNYAATNDVAKITFTAKKAGEVSFILNENSAGASGYVGVVDTIAVKVVAPVSKTWKENVSWSDPDDANKTAIWWGFDIAAETFGDHQFVTVTDGADVPKTKTVGIGLADDYEVSGEGNVSFAVAVILDKADVTDKFDAYLGR